MCNGYSDRFDLYRGAFGYAVPTRLKTQSHAVLIKPALRSFEARPFTEANKEKFTRLKSFKQTDSVAKFTCYISGRVNRSCR